MASDVLRGSTVDHRFGTAALLVAGVALLAAGVWPWDTGEATGTEEAWVRIPFLAAAAPFLLLGVRRLGRPVPVPTLEVGRDALRWSDGRRREETVVRAAVTSIRRQHYKGVTLTFHDASGERVAAVPIDPFDHDALDAALARHRWPTAQR